MSHQIKSIVSGDSAESEGKQRPETVSAVVGETNEMLGVLDAILHDHTTRLELILSPETALKSSAAENERKGQISSDLLLGVQDLRARVVCLIANVKALTARIEL